MIAFLVHLPVFLYATVLKSPLKIIIVYERPKTHLRYTTLEFIGDETKRRAQTKVDMYVTEVNELLV